MILIFDYGVGNLASIANMLKKVGVKSKISNDEKDLVEADKIILPGVGSFEYGIKKLRSLSSFPRLEHEVIVNKKPLLGICLGAQLLFEESEEGGIEGLSWIKGNVVRFEESKLVNNEKVPHMGWNYVTALKDSKLLNGLGDKARFYFVHSYHFKVFNLNDSLLLTEYGYEFVAAVEKDNIMGVQFHPEKSHKFGLKLLHNFVKNY
ncbi:imidazole glycerol phosphate synthase subunit HisH [Sphingobacterium faecale]|uniref:Imidazole glycerol phosphate synthase subunit HisH n=1 Tax=Sphingobacterium faecale TaxID=2803775 RepID=A0ABS1R6K1_9SPHI|nr:imidazole glycerol phosphate synthase subunit HisH [Sphingobacterium faecale]MBL1410345.1 imidazole glycerol phosphate synthase subunit HisH [Sphingobacterium faecale]